MPSFLAPSLALAYFCCFLPSLMPLSQMPSFLLPPLASAWFCLVPLSSFLSPLFALASFCSWPLVSAFRSLFTWMSLSLVFLVPPLVLAWWESSCRPFCLLLCRVALTLVPFLLLLVLLSVLLAALFLPPSP